jgi:hypothetical protein
MLWTLALLLLGTAFAEEEEADSGGSYSIMKDLEITMVMDVLDGCRFTIRDKENKLVTVRVGTLQEAEDASHLRSMLQRSMILYRPYPEDLQSTDGEVHADVWTAEGLHIGLALSKKPDVEATGVTTNYTMDILQVAAEQEKQKSYKDLEKALKDQANWEGEQARAAQEEEAFAQLKGKDGLLVVLVVFAVGLFGYPLVLSLRGDDSEAKTKAARLKAAKMKVADAEKAQQEKAAAAREEAAKRDAEKQAREEEEARRQAELEQSSRKKIK